VVQALAHGGQATREALWGYQSAYLSYRWNNRIVDHGAGISAMEALRPLLQNVTQDEFDRLVRLADSDTVAALYRYDWSALRSVARVLVALLRQPSLCLRLGTGLYHMLRLRRHLLSYPRTSDDYLDWKCDLDAILRSSGIVPVAHSSP
jgi:hypothetical protein